MVLSRAEFSSEVSRRVADSAFWWNLSLGFVAALIPWGVRVWMLADVGGPELYEILIGVGVVVVLEAGRRWRGRSAAAYEIYRETAEIADSLALELHRLQAAHPRAAIVLVEEGGIVYLEVENHGS